VVRPRPYGRSAFTRQALERDNHVHAISRGTSKTRAPRAAAPR
jgi:hypothetical protein